MFFENSVMVQTPHMHFKLKGRKFFFRPIFPSDKIFIKRGFRELSPKSRYLRFFAHQTELTKDQLTFFTEVDGKNHVAWGVMDLTGFQFNPAGIGRFVRLKNDPSIAEVAITIVDAYQRSGLGRTMIAILNIIGYQLGIRTFRYHVLPENIGILESLNPLSERIKSEDKSVLMLDAKIFPSHSVIEKSPKTEKFIEVMKRVEEKLKVFQNDL